MALSKVSEDENLYISGIFSLSRKEAMREANITHVLSVLQISLDTDMFEPYQHMRIDVNDVESENLLEHFPAANAFIRKGLDGGGGVLVHW
ncbi:MAG: hypothetical protein M4579_004795 [Chaenotheca gracillima]|nr:MAG: hypothetical protein M4579_004795 [Chaenotheca gracillima]